MPGERIEKEGQAKRVKHQMFVILTAFLLQPFPRREVTSLTCNKEHLNPSFSFKTS